MKPFIEHTPSFLTLHHEGVVFDGVKDSAAEYLGRVQHWSLTNRGWPDIPYHYILGLQGEIFEGRPVWAQGDTNTSYDLRGHVLVAVLGEYNIQQPNQDQLDAIVYLTAWLAQEHHIPLSKIAGHKDYIPVNSKGQYIDNGVKITCPGDHLYAYLQNLYIHEHVARLLGHRQEPTQFQRF